MVKGSEIRKADHPIEKVLLDRWSPRAMSGEEISHEELMRSSKRRAGRRHHSIRSNGARFMRVAVRSTGRRSSICLWMRTRRGQRTRPFLSSSFHERISIIMTSRQSRIRTTVEQRGRISRCKAFNRVWWCTACKDSITIGRAKSCGSLTNSKSKRWQLSGDRGRKNCFLKNCRLAKALTIGGNFRKASLRDRLSLNSF